MNFKKLYCYQILQIIIGITLLVMLVIKQYKRSTENNTDEVVDVIISKEFILFLPLVLIFLTECQFAIYGFILYQRFCHVNAALRNMIKLSDNIEIYVIKVAAVQGK